MSFKWEDLKREMEIQKLDEDLDCLRSETTLVALAVLKLKENDGPDSKRPEIQVLIHKLRKRYLNDTRAWSS
jgi:hypothetical protein